MSGSYWLDTCKTFGLKSLTWQMSCFSYMSAICSLCKNYIVKAIQEQQTMRVSALPEIILTPAEEDTPDVSFHTTLDFSDRGGSGSSLLRIVHEPVRLVGTI